MQSLISVSAILGFIIYLIVAIEYSLILRKSGVVFLPAFLFSAVWSLGFWLLDTPSALFTLDLVYILVWSSCLLLVFNQRQQLGRFSLRWGLVWSIPALALTGVIYSLVVDTQKIQFGFYLYLLCCIGTLLITELHIRNSDGLVRTVSLGIGAMFLFNLYLYSKSLIVGYVPVDIAQARVLASTSVGLILSLMPLTIARDKNYPIKLSPSRPLVFTTTSLVLAATTLLLVSIVGYLFTIGNGKSAAVIQPFFLFLGVLFIGFNLASASRRAKIRVWVFKNFFQTKYNYNDEWRHLSERLARKSSNEHYGDIAIRAVLPIYNGTGGVFYLFRNDDKGGSYSPESKINIDDDLEPINDWDSPAFFSRMLMNNWIFVPPATDPGLAKFNDLLPGQLRDLDSTLIILPLINNAKLLGFLAITAEMDQVDRFDWEDIDLLRMVGKQIANFVGNQILSEELVVTRQFEAYHQFTTFVMHDLKNLIAQQALVVENAGRFADNPEFIADAIKTIDNSVKKMNQLLLTINQNRALVLEQSQQHPVSLVEVFESVLTQCNGREPNPVLHQEGELLLVDADSDNLLMAFTHLITNAQEACDSSGRIDITLKRTNSTVECKIIDTGTGMNQDFIDHRLFKPFDSTKKNRGLGIGAYQFKQIVSNAGGVITVTSKIGEGTCFTVTLPLSN